jgi:dihydroflavonol-4-reductase
MILVTGATGLVGAHLLIHLIENQNSESNTIRAIYRNIASIEKTKSLFAFYKKEFLLQQIEWVPADITDVPSLEIAFQNIKTVYHCAALISFDPKDENKLRKINIEGTANVVNFCIAYGIEKLCFISSIATLGDLLPHEKYISEETEWNPEQNHSDYAISKYGAEMEVWRGHQEGLDVIIINPGVILGPVLDHKDWEQGSGQLLTQVKKGLKYYTKGTSGFVAVTDVVQIAMSLMESNIKNERFIVIAENIAFQEILNTMADSLHVKRPNTHASPFLMEILWRLDWLSSVVFRTKRKLSKITAKATYTQNTYSNHKIKQQLNFNFTTVKPYLQSTIKPVKKV